MPEDAGGGRDRSNSVEPEAAEILCGLAPSDQQPDGTKEADGKRPLGSGRARAIQGLVGDLQNAAVLRGAQPTKGGFPPFAPVGKQTEPASGRNVAWPDALAEGEARADAAYRRSLTRQSQGRAQAPCGFDARTVPGQQVFDP